MPLTPLERVAARTLFATVFPSVEGQVPGADQLDLIPHYEDLLARAPPLHAAGIRAAVLACVLVGPLLLAGRPRTLMGLDPAGREECLGRLVTHPVYLARQLGLLLKAICAMVYFQEDRVRTHLGLPPAADPGGAAAPIVR